jgi:predicted  nucleic acid-binding Zn-ribbon protein
MTKVAATERQIDRIALYSSSNAALRLCPTHQRELRQTMARDVRRLVESPFFQTQFSSYLPSSGSNGAHMSITRNGLQVQKLQYDNEMDAWDVVDGTAIVELTGDGATNEGLQISQEMISDADHVYQRCLRAHLADGTIDSHQVSRIDLEEGPLPASHRSLTARTPLFEEWQRAREESSQLRRKLEEAEKTRSDAQSQVEELLRARNTAPATLMDAKLLQTCLALAEQFAAVGTHTEIPGELIDAFNRLDPKVRDSIFFHIYLLNSSERYDDWNLGRYYFFNEHQHGQDFKATNAQRALAIRHFVLEHLAENFETARTFEMASAAMAVFGLLPTEEKNNVYRHLWHILKPSPREDYYRYGEFAFLSQQGRGATHIQRGRAIANHLQEKLMEHRRGLIDRAVQRLTGELTSVERKAAHFEKEYARVQLELEALQRKLDTASRLASRIPNLEADLRDAQTQIARISGLEHDLDAARLESHSRQERIKELERELQTARLLAARIPVLESDLHAAQIQAARVPGLKHDLDEARSQSQTRQERIEELDRDLQAVRLMQLKYRQTAFLSLKTT